MELSFYFCLLGALEARTLHFLDMAIVLRNTKYSERQGPLETLLFQLLVSKVEDLRARGPYYYFSDRASIGEEGQGWERQNSKFPNTRWAAPGVPTERSPRTPPQNSLSYKKGCGRRCIQTPAEILSLINAGNLRDKGGKYYNSTKPC